MSPLEVFVMLYLLVLRPKILSPICVFLLLVSTSGLLLTWLALELTPLIKNCGGGGTGLGGLILTVPAPTASQAGSLPAS
jgi:hypothetical protein